jgi:hypothetical protein
LKSKAANLRATAAAAAIAHGKNTAPKNDSPNRSECLEHVETSADDVPTMPESREKSATAHEEN